MPYATITGQLKDSDGTAWSNATWTAVPVSPSSKPVFPDGSPVPVTGGLLDATGNFSGEIPQTIDVRPPGTTLTITVTSMTSASPVTITKVQIVAAAVDLGALLSPRLVAPRIKAAAVVYAYNSVEVTNPVHGSGYINTIENQSYIYMQNSWVKIGVGGLPEDVVRLAPVMNEGDLNISESVYALGGIWGGPALVNGIIHDFSVDNYCFRDVLGNTPTGHGFHSFRCVSGDTTSTIEALFLASTGVTCEIPLQVNSTVHASGAITSDVSMYASGAIFGGAPNGTIHDFCNGNYCFRDALGNTPTGHGFHSFRCVTGDTTNTVEPLFIATTGVNCAVPLAVAGTIHATGTITSDAGKAFKITHPLDESKILMHGCIEGPEFGVYYRGEAELVDGRSVVELPDYFEALTFPDDRTVLLTQVDDGGELALLAASRVVDGKFSIRSNVSAALVSWEVKAVRRAGVDRLEVEQAKTGERSEGES